MGSTRITLTPELQSRFATGHNELGYRASYLDCGALKAAGGLRSTANDMVKYMAANLGLVPSTLTPLMEKTREDRFEAAAPSGYLNTGGRIGLAWFVVSDPHGRRIVRHGGTSAGYNSFVGLDLTRRRGVVVLSNAVDWLGVHPIGNLLLESEWQSDRRPKETRVSSRLYDSCVGQYQLSPDIALGASTLRQLLGPAAGAAICISTGFCLALTATLLWRVRGRRKWCVVLGVVALVGGVSVAMVAQVLSQKVCSALNPGIGIRREGDRVFARYTVRFSPGADRLPAFPVPLDLWPATWVELLPESESEFFVRLTGMRVTFVEDDRGHVTRLIAHSSGATTSFSKVSDQPPKAPEPWKNHVAVELDTKLIDAVAGRYDFASCPALPFGAKMAIWREGDHGVRQAWEAYGFQRAVNRLDPESETMFFVESNGAELTFIKNDRGEVTAVVHHEPGQPDFEGKKLRN